MTSQRTLLSDEVNNDPSGKGYSGMSNIAVADSLNTKNVSKNKTALSNTKILEAIDPIALIALTGDGATRVWGILSIPSVDPFGVAAEIIKNAFGSQSDTVTALAALRKYNISRAEDLGIRGTVGEGHVEAVRIT